MKTRRKPRGFDATALQVHRAYVARFNRPLPNDLSFSEAGDQLVRDMGADAAREFILSQSNDPASEGP